MVLAIIFTCIFFDLDPAKSFQLRQAARTVAQQLGGVVESHVKSVGSSGFLSSIVDNFRHHEDTLSGYGSHMIRRLLDNGLGASEVTWSHILPTASAMVPNQSQVVSLA
jgi:linoleate 10R-lipoxygenase